MKYIENGRYNASPNMIVYYEKSGKNLFISKEKDKLEVCYGPLSGGCDYWDLDLKHEKALLEIVEINGFDTRKILKYIRDNTPKEEEVKNGLGVKLNLVGKNGNAFAILALFRRTARKQGLTDEQINPILDEAKKGDYSHLIYTISSNCN